MSRCETGGLINRLLPQGEVQAFFRGGSKKGLFTTVAGARFAPRDSGTDEMDPGGAERRHAAGGVRKVAVAAIDDDVAGLEMRKQLRDDGVHRRPRLHHQEDPPWPGQGRRQCGDRVGPRDRGPGGRTGEVLGDAFGGPVVDRDAEPVVVEVEGQVLAHHGEANQADVGGHGLSGRERSG